MRFSSLRAVVALSLLGASSLVAQSKPTTKTAEQPAMAQSVPKPPKAGQAGQAAPAAAKLIDINAASATELEAIPGIGKAFAAKIIGGRPYANKLQLVQKKILTQVLYDKIKDQIIAKQ